MSLAAAAAMRDLADCLRDEGDGMPTGTALAVMLALARAHEAAADRIEARAKGAVPCPPEFKQKGQAGTRKGERG